MSPIHHFACSQKSRGLQIFRGLSRHTECEWETQRGQPKMICKVRKIAVPWLCWPSKKVFPGNRRRDITEETGHCWLHTSVWSQRLFLANGETSADRAVTLNARISEVVAVCLLCNPNLDSIRTRTSFSATAVQSCTVQTEYTHFVNKKMVDLYIFVQEELIPLKK